MARSASAASAASAATENPFGPVVAPTPAVDPKQLVERLTKLQHAVAAADRERATADTLLAQAKKDLAEIDAQLTQLGVDPAKADETLNDLEGQLATLTAQFEQHIEAERKVYAQIVAAAS